MPFTSIIWNAEESPSSHQSVEGILLILEFKARLVIRMMFSFLHQFSGSFFEACSFLLPSKASVLLSALSVWISDSISCWDEAFFVVWTMLNIFCIRASRLKERKHISPSFSVMIMTWRLMPPHVNPDVEKGQMDKPRCGRNRWNRSHKHHRLTYPFDGQQRLQMLLRFGRLQQSVPSQFSVWRVPDGR